MIIDPSIFKSYDIRGIYPTQINEENTVQIIRAIYRFFYTTLGKEQPTIVLAYDMRLSGPQLFEVAKKTLIEMGANEIDAGQLSTPSFYFAVFLLISISLTISSRDLSAKRISRSWV